MAASEIVTPRPSTSGDRAQPWLRSRRHAVTMSLLAIVALTALGAVPRVIVAHQSVFADELSTYWISVTHGLGGVLSLLYSTGRIHHAEITPPLSFLASWLSTRLGTTAELLRAPALLAGTATIPLIYALGRRTVGRRAALLAATVTALSPFMIYYSAEARAYGLMICLVVCSILTMLLAIDTGRNRYWVLYAIFSAAAFYTHYTCTFVLAVALLWLLWSEPAARRPALLANAGAALLVVPWIPGLIADLHSPTVKILSALSPFTANAVRVDIQHWALGYPYTVAGGLRDLPGVPALLLLVAAALLSAVGVATGAHAAGRHDLRRRSRDLLRPGSRAAGSGSLDRRIVLVLGLMLATPVGEIAGSAVGNHIIGVRDLAASWPFLALFAAAFVIAAGPRLGTVAAALTVVAFALAAPKMLEARFQRPGYQAAANYVAADARAGNVVIDETGGLSPGPLTGFDIVFHRRLPVFRALAPAERDHPFTVFDPFVSLPEAAQRAIAAAHGARVFLVAGQLPGVVTRPDPVPLVLPDGYRRTSLRSYPGIELTLVGVYSRSRDASR